MRIEEKSKYLKYFIILIFLIKYALAQIQIFLTFGSNQEEIFCCESIELSKINVYLIKEKTNENTIINSQLNCISLIIPFLTANQCIKPAIYTSSIKENETILIEFIESPQLLRGLFKQSSAYSIILKSNNVKLNITDYGLMFTECLELKRVDLSNFNFSTAKILEQMFSGDINLEMIKFPDNINFTLVEDYSRMFENCSKLISIDLSSFSFSKGKNLNSLFFGCNNLETIKWPEDFFSQAEDYAYMFYNCYKLTSIDLSNFNFNYTNIFSYMFYNCTNRNNKMEL